MGFSNVDRGQFMISIPSHMIVCASWSRVPYHAKICPSTSRFLSSEDGMVLLQNLSSIMILSLALSINSAWYLYPPLYLQIIGPRSHCTRDRAACTKVHSQLQRFLPLGPPNVSRQLCQQEYAGGEESFPRYRICCL